MIYLDHNATTQPTPDVIAAMTHALELGWANPSSLHRPGQVARHVVDQARIDVGALLGCADRDIVFTAGGTEADNLAVLGSLSIQPGRNVVVSSRVEHSAIRSSAEFLAEAGTEVVWLGAESNGLVDVLALKAILEERASEIALVSLMWANNETGVIQPIETMGRLCREHRVRFHTDAVQWVGKMPTNLSELPIDLLSFSAHKFHGPKGCGGLYVRPGLRLAARSLGGSQERSRRGGTENVSGIAGLGAAAAGAQAWLATDGREGQRKLRDRFETEILARVPDAVVNGAAAPRIWNTSNIGFPRLEAEALLLLLSERGLCAAAGAACGSGSLDPSPVLLAMGVEREVAHGSVRFSLSRDTTEAEIDDAIEIVVAVVEKLRTSLPVA